MKKCFKFGFTLAELVIALAIIGIITALAVPIINRQISKTEEYSYYLAYRTLERISEEILSFGDDDPYSQYPSRTPKNSLSQSNNSTYFAKILKYGNYIASIIIPRAHAVGGATVQPALPKCCCTPCCQRMTSDCCLANQLDDLGSGKDKGDQIYKYDDSDPDIPSCTLEAKNDSKICCDDEPPLQSGHTYYGYTNDEGNSYCISCPTGKYAPNLKACCPEHSKVVNGNCECETGYKENAEGTECINETGSCPSGYYLDPDDKCVINARIDSPQLLCEKIKQKWNIQSGNGSSCDTFSQDFSKRPSALYKVGDKYLINELLDTVDSQKIFMGYNLGDKVKFNEITPNIIFSNGQKLWIVGGRYESLPGLTQNIVEEASGHGQLCTYVGGPSMSSYPGVSERDYFCSAEQRYYYRIAASSVLGADARACCINPDKTDIYNSARNSVNNMGYDLTQEDKNKMIEQIYQTDPRVIAESGFLVMMDINGDKGNGILWQDVFPFYLTDSGKVIPGYPISSHKKDILDNTDKDNSTLYVGGNNPAYLTADVYYFEKTSNNRNKVPVFTGVSYAKAACESGLISKYSAYCLNLGSNHGVLRDKDGNVVNENPCSTHKCFMTIRKKIKFL